MKKLICFTMAAIFLWLIPAACNTAPPNQVTPANKPQSQNTMNGKIHIPYGGITVSGLYDDGILNYTTHIKCRNGEPVPKSIDDEIREYNIFIYTINVSRLKWAQFYEDKQQETSDVDGWDKYTVQGDTRSGGILRVYYVKETAESFIYVDVIDSDNAPAFPAKDHMANISVTGIIPKPDYINGIETLYQPRHRELEDWEINDYTFMLGDIELEEPMYRLPGGRDMEQVIRYNESGMVRPEDPIYQTDKVIVYAFYMSGTAIINVTVEDTGYFFLYGFKTPAIDSNLDEEEFEKLCNAVVTIIKERVR